MGGLIGSRIKAIRCAKGISQNGLAKLAGMSQSGLSSIENGASSPSASTIEMLAKSLHVSVAELIDEEAPAANIPSDDDIKFALFGDPSHITDAQFEEVKRFARFIEERAARDK